MRILLVIPQYHHEERSRQTARTQRLEAGLVQADHDVSVVTGKWWGQSSPTHHHRWTTHYAAGRSKLSAPRVANQIRQHDPDVVHLVDVPPVVVAVASMVTDAPLVYEATGFDSPLGRSRFAERLTRYIDEIIVPSEVIETTMLARGISGTTTTLPDPIHIDLIESVSPISGVDLVWSADSLTDAHLEDLLLALAELDSTAWSTVILLESDIDQAIEEIDTYDLLDQIDILQQPTRRERVAVYRGADIFVQTANHCRFATELLWAMGAGCIGLVQYQPESSAHNLVTEHNYGVRVSNPDDLVSGFHEASELPTSDFEPYFSRYDVSTIVGQLTGRYRRLL